MSLGLADLTAGRETVESLLVQSVSIRMGQLGIVIPPKMVQDPNVAIYALLAAEVGERRAHGRYNALRRRLAKFLRSASALEAGNDAASD